MKTLAPVTLALALLSGCGVAPAQVAVTSGTSSAVAQSARPTGGTQLYGSVFQGTVVTLSHPGKTPTLLLSALPSSQWGGQVRVTVVPGIGAGDEAVTRSLKVGDQLSLFVDYTVVDMKAKRILDLGRPYQAFNLKLLK